MLHAEYMYTVYKLEMRYKQTKRTCLELAHVLEIIIGM